jgi:hypothetical protein
MEKHLQKLNHLLERIVRGNNQPTNSLCEKNYEKSLAKEANKYNFAESQSLVVS